jgi:DNA-binding response OmpR family regulator
MISRDRTTPATVLAVDDDPAFLESLGVVLSASFTFLTAQSGPQALEVVQRQCVDVVLLDLLMPEMHGLEVLSRLRERDPTIPVVVVTGLKDAGDVVKAMKAGAYDYVTKPWGDDDDLIALIRAAARDRLARTAVLLLSMEPAALAPLEVALHAQTKVVAATPRIAATLAMRADAVVIDSPLTSSGDVASAHAVRARFPDAPLVMITSKPRIQEIGPLAPAAVFVKPYPLDEMLRRLTELLAARSRRLRGWPLFSPPIRTALDTLARRYSEPLTVSELAQAAALSTDRLVHAFREALGMSPKEFAKRLRVAVSSRLLRETDLKLEEVARRTGFSNGSHFSRMFEDARGVRPGEYRRGPWEI